MADRFYTINVTTPSGTAKLVPLSTVWKLEDAYLTVVTIIVPDGHNGLTGIRLVRSLQEVFPWSNNDWLTANGEKVDVPYNDAITASGFTIQTYNTDIFSHTYYLRAIITDTAPSNTVAGRPLTMISNSDLASAPQLGSVGRRVGP